MGRRGRIPDIVLIFRFHFNIDSIFYFTFSRMLTIFVIVHFLFDYLYRLSMFEVKRTFYFQSNGNQNFVPD